jgi:leucyl-tRNA synthetase
MSNTSCTLLPFAFTLVLIHGLCRTFYKDAMKYGFYELQSARDWYREVTADIGMHADLVRYWISVAALLATPIAPHFAEHIWRGILHHPTSIQRALWPTPSQPVDTPTIEAGAYMRALVKNARRGTDAAQEARKSHWQGRPKANDSPIRPKEATRAARLRRDAFSGVAGRVRVGCAGGLGT